jgi:uncharacterized protein (DUF1684 family)
MHWWPRRRICSDGRTGTIDVMRLCFALVLTAVAAACTSGPQPMDDTSYDRDILASRAAKDAMLRQADSPLLPENRTSFTGLPYFAVNSLYRMPARLDEDRSNTAVIELSTSSTEKRRMQRVGSLRFTFNGRPLALTAFADEGTRTITRLFVPFGDLTSGETTYGGGRYLDLDRTPTGLYDLDFNRAYHPYCVYNISYVCPVPPRENRLDIAVLAGERLPAGYKGGPGQLEQS